MSTKSQVYAQNFQELTDSLLAKNDDQKVKTKKFMEHSYKKTFNISIEGTDYVFPVANGILKDENNLDLKNIAGTAFSIGPKTFITAGHVFEQMEDASQKYGISEFVIAKYNKQDGWGGIKITSYEINKEYDIAVFKADFQEAKKIEWMHDVGLNTDVSTIGFPLALDVHNAYIDFRFFKGYVVGKRPHFYLDSKPQCYELSFMCPRGLSGAFILSQKNFKICGIVIGNRDIEIPVSFETEEDIRSNLKTISQKVELTRLGLALTSSAILDVRFDMLNSSLGEFIGLKSIEHNLNL